MPPCVTGSSYQELPVISLRSFYRRYLENICPDENALGEVSQRPGGRDRRLEFRRRQAGPAVNL